MIVAAGKDVRVLVIKLADRLHNMRTLDARSAASRARIATATQDVLVPLCDRLGIQALKRELEDAVLWPPGAGGVRAGSTRTCGNRPDWDGYLAEWSPRPATALRRSQRSTPQVVAAAPALLLDLEGHGRRRPRRSRSTCPASRSSSTGRRPTATRRWARYTASGARCPAGSRTSSPRRRTTSTARCTPRCTGPEAGWSRC